MFAESEHAVLSENKASALHVVWYLPRPKQKPAPKDLDRYFRGSVEIATFRSSWNDSNALFVGVKGGFNQVAHGHLDLGNFEVYALGQPWAIDLGADYYGLEGYWSRGKGGQRWQYYRMNSFSHNVPLLGGKGQDENAESKFINFKSSESSASVLIDLTGAYKDFATKATRGVAMVANRRAVLVQDEFEIDSDYEVAWGITTHAKIHLPEKTGVAELELNGKQMMVKVRSPEGAEFVIESAEQKPPEKRNEGVSRLMLRLPKVKGQVRIAVLLSPVWDNKNVIATVDVKPLAKW